MLPLAFMYLGEYVWRCEHDAVEKLAIFVCVYSPSSAFIAINFLDSENWCIQVKFSPTFKDHMSKDFPIATVDALPINPKD